MKFTAKPPRLSGEDRKRRDATLLRQVAEALERRGSVFANAARSKAEQAAARTKAAQS